MMGGRGGVLSPEDARRLMSVLSEMTDYVDGEDLDSISAQKPIYESGRVGEEGIPGPPPPDESGEEESEGHGGAELMDALSSKPEAAPHGMMHTEMGGKDPTLVLEEKKIIGKPSVINRRR